MTIFPIRRTRNTVAGSVEDVAAVAAPFVLGAARIVIGFLFACHGVSALFGVWGRDAVAVGAWPGFYAAVIQLVCGVLVALGAGTRTAALVGSGSMAYAYFSVHQEAGLLPITNGGEPAALFCWTLLAIAAAGPGALRAGTLLTSVRRPGVRAVPAGAPVATTTPETVTTQVAA